VLISGMILVIPGAEWAGGGRKCAIRSKGQRQHFLRKSEKPPRNGKEKRKKDCCSSHGFRSHTGSLHPTGWDFEWRTTDRPKGCSLPGQPIPSPLVGKQ